MYIVEGPNGKIKQWSAAIDEGYGRNPHIEVNVRFTRKSYRDKVTLKEAPVVARMLRGLADEIEQVAKEIASRHAATEHLRK
jgi:hypothetical protein